MATPPWGVCPHAVCATGSRGPARAKEKEERRGGRRGGNPTVGNLHISLLVPPFPSSPAAVFAARPKCALPRPCGHVRGFPRPKEPRAHKICAASTTVSRVFAAQVQPRVASRHPRRSARRCTEGLPGRKFRRHGNGKGKRKRRKGKGKKRERGGYQRRGGQGNPIVQETQQDLPVGRPSSALHNVVSHRLRDSSPTHRTFLEVQQRDLAYLGKPPCIPKTFCPHATQVRERHPKAGPLNADSHKTSLGRHKAECPVERHASVVCHVSQK